MSSNVSVVIPTYNGARFIREALESLFAQTLPPHEIIVIDDASTDGTPDVIEREYPQVTLIRKSKNGGFGETCNMGIQHALDNGTDFVWLLNQDLTVQNDCLERLAAIADSSPEYGLLSAFQLTYDGTMIDRPFRNYMPLEYWDDLLLREPQQVYSANFMPAAAVLMRREMLFDVGGFDPLFYMYGEDDDLCRRINAMGWKIGVVPAARVHHWHGVVNTKRTFKWHYNFEYSGVLLHLKASPRRIPLALLAYFRYFARTNSWKQRVARFLAYIRCVFSAYRISKSRNTVPMRFADRTIAKQPGATSETPAETAIA